MAIDLRRVDTDDLEHELLRRRKWREEHTPKPIPYCDECDNFVAYTGEMDTMPADYNPCRLKHKMSFRMPDSPTTNDWGFYRLHCKDWRTDAAREGQPQSNQGETK